MEFESDFIARRDALTERLPEMFASKLVDAFVPRDTSPRALLELTVIVQGENISTREFAMYLALVDRLYGRLSPKGLMSYAHQESGRLKIAEIHKSELQIVFQMFYEHAESVKFIAILLFLRSLPKMLKTLAEAYKSFEEAREVGDRSEIARLKEKERKQLTRLQRKAIRETINEEPASRDIDETSKRRLVSLLNALFAQELSSLSGPIRFARQQVMAITLRIKKND